MATDQERVQELVRQMYESAQQASWDLTAEKIRGQRRHRGWVRPDPKAVALVIIAIGLIVAGFVVFGGPSPHRSAVRGPLTVTTTTAPQHHVVVPAIAGLTQARAQSLLESAGLKSGDITGIISAGHPAGTVIASNPTAGEVVAKGSLVSLTVSSGSSGLGAPSSTVPATSNCASGKVSYLMSTETASICVAVGASLTVTFALPGRSGYGSWSRSPPTISDNSVLAGVAYGHSATQAWAVFTAVGRGTATVVAQFDVTCGPDDSTPCTVPPGQWETLTVTVDAA